jgi:hypothetical protein
MLHEFDVVRAVHIPHEILFVVSAEALEHAPVLSFGLGSRCRCSTSLRYRHCSAHLGTLWTPQVGRRESSS